MKLLTRIANLCNTDKGTNYLESHGYTEFYDDIFSKYAGKEINILEIGILDGGSLKMYNAYFDGKCNIYALDIEDKEEFNSDNIKTFICDQGSHGDLINFKDTIGDIKFDLIIDDGSHASPHQTTSMYFLHDLLKEDGYYIIEDLHCYKWWNDIENSTLYSLMFEKPFVSLTEEQSNLLHSKIDTVQIWSKKNEKCGDNISITSVIKFKQ